MAKPSTFHHARTLLALAGLALPGLVISAGCAWFGASTYETPIVEKTPPNHPADPATPAAHDSSGEIARGWFPSNPEPRKTAHSAPTNPHTTFAADRFAVEPKHAPRRQVESDVEQLATIDVNAHSTPPATAPVPTITPPANIHAAGIESAPPLNLSQVTFAGEGADFDPCVSSDGTKIVYASTQHRETADIYIKPADGKVVTQLTNDAGNDVMPTLSPDGAHIAFASDRSGNWDVYVMPTAGGQAVQITSDPSDELHPSWSPDGRQLVFCRLGASSGRWEMWVIETDNQAVSHFIGYGLFPSWSPVAGTGGALPGGASDKILFQLGRERGDRAFAVWTVDYRDGHTGNATELASSTTHAFINPAWSPEGDKVVYAAVPVNSAWSDRGPRSPASADLWMVNTDGTGRVNVTASGTVALMPVWGRNNRLYFVAERAGTSNIWSLDLEPSIRAAAISARQGASRTAKAATPAKPPTETAEPKPAADEMADAPEPSEETQPR